MRKFIRKGLKSIKKIIVYISPKLGVYILHFIHYRKIINLKNPKTIVEKIEWLKFNYYQDNKLVKQCADKYAVRDYIKGLGYGKLLNELIAIYETTDEIDWGKLPQKFALKWNFGNGYNIICSNKENIDFDVVIAKLDKWDKEKAHLKAYEPQYEVDKKILICEKFIDASPGFDYPLDYKIYCFNGEAHFLILYTDRKIGNKQTSFNFHIYDRNMNWIPYKNTSNIELNQFVDAEVYEKLFDYAEILAKPFPFVRVDFYVNNDDIIFGEMTFTPGGMGKIDELIDLGLLPNTLLNLSIG